MEPHPLLKINRGTSCRTLQTMLVSRHFSYLEATSPSVRVISWRTWVCLFVFFVPYTYPQKACQAFLGAVKFMCCGLILSRLPDSFWHAKYLIFFSLQGIIASVNQIILLFLGACLESNRFLQGCCDGTDPPQSRALSPDWCAGHSWSCERFNHRPQHGEHGVLRRMTSPLPVRQQSSEGCVFRASPVIC